MTVTDIDLTDTIDVSVDSVAISGSSYNAADVPLSNDQLKAMLGLSGQSTELFEYGSIEALDENWTTINLGKNYSNPVIILGDAIGNQELNNEAAPSIQTSHPTALRQESQNPAIGMEFSLALGSTTL